jgi:hypothetical protein
MSECMADSNTTDQALTSFNGLLKEMDPASAEDIQAYRAWMEKRAPIDVAETRFLERKNDLLAVWRPTAVVSTTRGSRQPPQSADVIWMALALVLPLLAFAIVPSLLGRLVVIGLIAAVEARQVTLTPELMNYMTFREWSLAAAM